MSKKTTSIYYCDRCGRMAEQNTWPDKWESFELPYVFIGKISQESQQGAENRDLCDKCVQSLIEWGSNVK